MQIEEVKFQNFKGFEKGTLEFKGPGVHVLVGDNGTGKTGVLEALVIGASFFFIEVGEKTYPIEKGYHVRKTIDNRVINDHYPVRLEFKGNFLGQDYKWMHQLDGENNRTIIRLYNNKSISVNNKSLIKQWPFIGYYGIDRLIAIRDRRNIEVNFNNKFLGYSYALESKTNLNRLLKWFAAFEVAFVKGRFKHNLNQYIIDKIKLLLPEIINIDFLQEEENFIISLNDGRTVTLNNLSTGYRILISTFLDILIRMVILNYNEQELDFKSMDGMIMIDEIDLNLHPKLQESIIYKLEEEFPKIQFIVTTHSPIIAASVQPEKRKYLVLENGILSANPGYAPQGVDPNQILMSDMGLESVYTGEALEAVNKLSEINNKLGTANKENYSKLLAEFHAIQEKFNIYKTYEGSK